MRISRLTTAVVEANFDWTLVRVETDEGISGIGEAFFAPGLTTMIREFGTVLAGENPLDVDRLYYKMRWASSAGSIAGYAFNAISGIEAALWDLKGRALGVPIWQLLGGRFRDRIRVYADCHAGKSLQSLGPLLQRRVPSWLGEAGTAPTGGYFDPQEESSEEYSPEAYARQAMAVAALGYTALKFDLDVPIPNTRPVDLFARGLGADQMKYLVDLVEATYAAVGRAVDLAFDCHWRLTVNDAIRLACALEHVPIAWLEDPTPPENPAALARVTAATTTPIGTGENWCGREGFREALAVGALDIVLPDIQKCGGLGEGKRIAELADMHDLQVAFHNISGPVGTLASAHLAAAIPNFRALEFHAMDVPFFDRLLVGAAPLIRDGHITVPSGPGLGAELDLDEAARYAKPGEPFFE